MNNKILLASLAMDLKRVALGYQRGSEKMARRFAEEAMKRKEEIEISGIKIYLRKFIKSLPKILNQKDKQKLAEDALMLSIIFQNHAITNFSQDK